MNDNFDSFPVYEEEYTKNIGDYLSILWRRKYYIIIPFIIVFILSAITAFLIPPVFKSTGKILVESPQVPEEFLGSNIKVNISERLQVIKQRLMTSQKLNEIINKFGLYQEARKNRPQSEILEDMRNLISIDKIDSNTSRRRGPAMVIAFTVSFEHNSSLISQKVANELVTIFLNENVKKNTELAEGTTKFFKNEGEKLKTRIGVIEQQIADFKQKNKSRLPEKLRVNLEKVTGLRLQVTQVENDLNDLEESKKMLEIDISTFDQRLVNPAIDNDNSFSPRAELQKLQTSLVSLSARYGENYPDVKALKRKIKVFKDEYGDFDNRKEIDSQLLTAKQERTELLKKYSSSHPDIRRIDRKIKSLNLMISEYQDNITSNEPVNDSPVFSKLKLRNKLIEEKIRDKEKSRKLLQDQISKLLIFIDQTPQVERALEELTRDVSNLKDKYKEIKSKQLQAELAMNLDENQKGERFTLIEAPLKPDQPIKPDRPKILLIGLALAMASGLGFAFLVELINGGVRGARALTALTGTPPLVTIPYITTKIDVDKRRRNLKVVIIIVTLIVIMMVIIIHFAYKPLDLLWFVILRKVGLA